MTTTAQEIDLRYPVGKFDWDAPISESEYPKLIAAVAETPGALRSAVAGLSRDQLETPYRPGGWTVKQVVHHLRVDGRVAAGQVRELCALQPEIRRIQLGLADLAVVIEPDR